MDFGAEKFIFTEAGRLKIDHPPRRVVICPNEQSRASMQSKHERNLTLASQEVRKLTCSHHDSVRRGILFMNLLVLTFWMHLADHRDTYRCR